jgi:starch synthase (maltosyl-transferring)
MPKAQASSEQRTATEGGTAIAPLPRKRPSRAVIQPVAPIVDGGRFPAKASIGEPIEVLADVFTDGHDHVAAAVRFRRAGDGEWSEVPMTPLGNDRHRAVFPADRIGLWELDITAWVDHFDTQRSGIVAKANADVDVAVELATLAELARAMRKKAKGPDRARLDEVLEVCAGGRYDPLLDSPELVELSWRTHARTPPCALPAPLTVFVDRARARCSAWYELFPRSAGAPGGHGTLADVECHLDRIAAMGFDIVYLPPIHPIGTTFRKGPDNTLEASPDDVGSPWAIGGVAGGHLAVHPELGTADDVARLAAACGERGVELALDLAFQCSPDHPWVTEHPAWFKHRADGTIQYAENPPKKYQDIYPIDFESDDWPNLWLALHGVVRYWADHGVRVFRVDNPHTKSFAFWEWLLASFRESDPDVLFLAEAFTRPRVMERLGKLGFHQSYTYFTWRTDPQELRRYFTELTSRTADLMRPNPWPNTPDILHAQLQHGGRPAFVVRAILASLLAANWGVYGPAFELQEHRPLRDGSEEYRSSEKYQLREWELDRADSLAPLLTRLNQLRRELPALQHDRTLRFHHTDDPAMLAWSKTDPNGVGDPVLVVVAADPSRDAAGEVDVDWAQLGLAYDGDYHLVDRFGGGDHHWHGARNFVRLSPHGLAAHVFTVSGPPAERPWTPPVDHPVGLS